MKATIITLLLAIVSFPAFTQNLSALDQPAKQKIDPLLQQSLLAKERFPDQAVTAIEYHAAGTRAAQSAGDMVGVLIESTGDIRPYVRSIGGIVGSRHGNIYTALLPVSRIAPVAQQPAVRYIEASRPLFPSLDLSLPKTGADVLHTLPDSIRLTGKGVIIGFTDSGINTDHPNFKTADGKTRILYVWDQYAFGTPPAGFSYGVEKDSAAINARTWSMPDWGAHGSHVAGIAAGNGLPSKQYVGMAPEADIIMVSNFGDDLFNRGLTTVGTLDGYDYIRGKANALGKRFVINTSQGTNLGPHDGTTLFEKAVDADIAAGGILVLSAGNEATSNRHASVTVTPAAPKEITCEINGSGFTAPMDIWYETNDRLVLRIKEADDPNYVTLFPAVDSTIVYAFDWAVVSVTTKIGSPLNSDNEIYITFRAFNQVTMQLEFSAAPGNTLPDGGRVDLWWERNYPVQFTTDVDQSITFGIPAGADSAITVASYNNRTGYGAEDDISSFSGRGPRRDGTLKPDISGLGGRVMSSVYSSSYDEFSGTSMSSPHVAGAAALLLQQDSTLKSYQVREKLQAAATADAYTGAVPNPTWGYGKLNVLKAAGFQGKAIVNVDQDTVDFGPVIVQSTKYDSIRIANPGSGDLTITSVTPSSGIFSTAALPFLISPRSYTYFAVSTTPTDTGDFSGYMDLTFDDSANTVVRVTVLGRGNYAPVAALSPDSLVFTVNEGERAAQNISINNAGQGPLKFQITADYLPQTAPGLRPVRTGIEPTWGHVTDELSVHSSVKAKFASTPLLPIIVQDPVGDASSSDVSEIRGQSAGGMVTLQLVMASTFDPNDFAGYLGLDIDQNPLTGTTMPFAAEGQDVGCEFFVDFFNLTFGVDLFTFSDSLGATYVGTFEPEIDVAGRKFTFSIPLSVLKNDEGRINIAAVLGNNYGPTDWAPDEGHGVVGFTWITANPEEGTVAPGGSLDVPITVNTGDLDGGKTYTAQLAITTNDPAKQFASIPVKVNVTTAQNLLVADSVQFGTIFVGYPDTLTLVLQNNGTPDLTIFSMSINDGQFTFLDPTNLNLAKDQKKTVRIRCSPSGAGDIAATLTINSNDPDSPTLPLSVTAHALVAPVIAFTPTDTLRASANEGDSVTAILTIDNTGGSDLKWEILKRDSTASRVLVWTGFVSDTFAVHNIKQAIWNFLPNVVFENSITVVASDLETRLASCDVFLLPWQGTASPAAMQMIGETLSSVLNTFVRSGKTLLVIDWTQAGGSFLKGTGLLNVSSYSSYNYLNGVVEDTSSYLVKNVYPYQYFYGSYHSSSDGKKIIREQVTGNNVLTHKKVGAGNVICFTIDGYNFPYEFAHVLANAVIPGLNFVTPGATSGTVAEESTYDLPVLFDASKLSGGIYKDMLRIASNDPTVPVALLPVKFSVTGKPVIHVEPSAITGATVYVGIARKDTIRIQNTGSELLSVTAVTSSDTTLFKSNKSSFFVAPSTGGTVVITTTVNNPGPYSGEITLTSNDVKTPLTSIPLSGTAIYAPVLTLSADSIVVAIDEGDSTTVPLTIGNVGPVNLKWNFNRLPLTTSLSLSTARTPDEIERIRVAQQSPSGNNKGTASISAYSMNALLSLTGGKRVLLWTGYSDNSPGGEAENTMTAIHQFAPDVSFRQTATESPSEFESLLLQADVFIVPEQENRYDLDVLGASFAPALTAFLQRGGTAIVMDHYESGATRFLKGANLLDVNVQGGGEFQAAVHDPLSHLAKDVAATFFAMNGSSFFTSSNGKKIIREAMTGNGYHLVTERKFGAGNLIYMGMDFYSYNSDMARVLANAVMSSMSGIISVSPDSGTISPEGSQIVSVSVNAKELPGGLYRFPQNVNSNDPLRNPKVFSVVVDVTAKPRIQLKPDSLSGVTAYVGVTREDSVFVRNAGSDLLVVSSVTSSDTSQFKVFSSEFYLQAREESAIVVSTTPKDTGNFRGEVTLNSNDAKNPAKKLVISGHAMHPPVIAVVPDSLVYSMSEGDSATLQMTISNSGLSALTWEYGSVRKSSGLAMRVTREIMMAHGSHWKPWSPPSSTSSSTPESNYQKGPRVGPTSAEVGSSGGTVPFFPLFGAVYNGIEQIDPRDATVIKHIPLSMSSGPDGLAYDGTWLYALVGYNDRIYKISPSTGTIVEEIPIPGLYYIDGLATNGDLLYLLDYNVGAIYVYDLTLKTFIATLAPGMYFGGGITFAGNRNTLFVSNFSSGIYEIDAATGSILNSLPSPGGVSVYGVAYSASADLLLASGNGTTYFLDPNNGSIVGSFSGYWFSGLAADEAPSLLMALNPSSGTVDPAGSQQVSVSAFPKGIAAGDYRFKLSLRTNDPVHNPREIPVVFHLAGKPIISVIPDTVRRGTIFAGIMYTDTIIVKNLGSLPLNITGLAASDTMFHLSHSSFSVPAKSQGAFAVWYTPTAPGALSGSITITSNDAVTPTVVVPLKGAVEHPSLVSVKPDSFLISMSNVDSLARIMTIFNDGLGELVWRIPGTVSASLSTTQLLVRSDDEIEAIRTAQTTREGNNKGTPTVGPFSISSMMTSTGTTKILVWTGYADTTEGGELENTMNAILQFKPDVTFELTATQSATEFATLLGSVDILIIPEQERIGDLSALGAQFKSAVTAFVQSGRTMIVLDYGESGSTTFLRATGLMSVISYYEVSYAPVLINDATSPLVKDLPASFIALNGANSHFANLGSNIIREKNLGYAVVTARDYSAGRVIYISMDYYSYNTSMARLLANAVSSSRGSFVQFSELSGTVAPGDSQKVTVYFKSKDLRTGDYTTTINLYTNDPLHNPMAIPVTVKRVVTGVEDVAERLPQTFALHQNFPNPFNPTTVIKYELPDFSRVTLKVYDMLGREVATLVNEERPAGVYQAEWNAAVSSGVYFYRLEAVGKGEKNFIETKKMILLR